MKGIIPTLKESLSRCQSTFIDEKTFAEWHEYNGKRLLMVVDESDESESMRSGDYNYPNIINTDIKMYAKKQDLNEIPLPGVAFVLDGRRCRTKKSSQNISGIVTIVAEAEE